MTPEILKNGTALAELARLQFKILAVFPEAVIRLSMQFPGNAQKGNSLFFHVMVKHHGTVYESRDFIRLRELDSSHAEEIIHAKGERIIKEMTLFIMRGGSQ